MVKIFRDTREAVGLSEKPLGVFGGKVALVQATCRLWRSRCSRASDAVRLRTALGQRQRQRHTEAKAVQRLLQKKHLQTFYYGKNHKILWR